ACVHSLVVLLFHSYHLHRYLHSFPTRRSSDLGIESRSSWTTTDSLAFGMLRPFGNEFGGGGILGFVPELPGPRGRRRTVSTGSCVGQGAGRVMFQGNTQSDLPVGLVGGDHRH